MSESAGIQVILASPIPTTKAIKEIIVEGYDKKIDMYVGEKQGN